MRRDRGDVRNEMVGAGSTTRGSLLGAKRKPECLNDVGEEQLGQMVPGDVIVLDRSPALRRHVASIFCAIVACPACGMPGLITAQQYFGVVPVICPSDRCSCHFRIQERSGLVYLPVN